MGLSSSSPITSYQQGDIIRQCNCYSRKSSSSGTGPYYDRTCHRHSLTFCSQFPDKRSKKRRSHGFATFKKKLIGRYRSFKGPDHGKLFREYALECPPEILRSLLSQYEVSTVTKDLSIQADLARPPAATLRQSLGDLFESQRCADLTLVYNGVRYPVHKSVIMSRCPYFNHTIIQLGSNSLEYHLPSLRYRICPETLRALLKYLYTGESVRVPDEDVDSMRLLDAEFGVPNSLESDLAFLYESGSFADCILTFGVSPSSSPSAVLDCGFNPLQLHCHRAVLASRSAFFRNLISRRSTPNDSCSNPLKIVLDETVILPKYGKVLLNTMYLDSIDFNLIEVNSPMMMATTTVITSSSSDKKLSQEQVDAAMDLYEIGRFLEFDLLSQNCEDALMASLSLENIIKILDWSMKPHGSAWIRRQAFQYLQEEFTFVANSDVFDQLDYSILKDLVLSDYTQASESEILQAIIRWGELQLYNKNEQKELVSSTYTLTRRSNPRRREICDSELRELIFPLLSGVRIQHILPKDRHSDILDTALHRNLIARPQSFLAQTQDATRYSAWDPRNIDGMYVKPRLFIPYYEECKNLLKDCYGQDLASELSTSPFPGVNIPDTLYMVKTQHDDVSDILDQQPNSIPDKERIGKMLKRTRKLLYSVAVQRAISSPYAHRWDIVHLVELRVVRECNLPDSYTSVLRKAELSEPDNDLVPEESRHSFDKYDLCMGQSMETDLEAANRPLTGPDVVTLASNILSSLSLQLSVEQPSSPDIVDGMATTTATTSCTTLNRRRHHPKIMSVSTTSLGSSSSSITNYKLSHSYCNGPSHMYL